MSHWTIHHGDALDVLRGMPDASVDAVITDPPYSSGGAFRGDRMASTTLKYVQTGVKVARADFTGDNRDQRAFGYWSALWLSECLRIAKPGAPLCVFTDWRQLPTTTDAVQAGGWIWRGIVPWNKTEAARPQLGRFRSQCEYVVFASNGPMGDGSDVGALPGFFEAVVAQSDKHHISGKPTAIMQEIARICPPGGTILDPFAGSGTTLVAALMEGRSAIGVERSADYIEIARARCQNVEAGNPPTATLNNQIAMFGGR